MKKKTAAIVEWKMPAMPPEKRISKTTAPLLKRAEEFVITSEDHFIVSGVMIQEIDRGIDFIGAELDPFVGGLYKLWKMAIRLRDGFVDPMKAQKKRLHALRTEWTLKQEEIKRRASEKMALGLQAQEKKEIEKARREAVRRGDTELAEVLEEQKNQVPLPFLNITPAVPKQEGFVVRERWRFEITDPAAVEREYCSPDESKIRKVVESMGDKAAISGIRIWLEKTEHSRSIA